MYNYSIEFPFNPFQSKKTIKLNMLEEPNLSNHLYKEDATCFFCGVSDCNEVKLQKCEQCSLVWYCGPRHAKLHRPKNTCYPVKIARHPSKGKL